MDETMSDALRDADLTMTARRWLPGDPEPEPTSTIATIAVDHAEPWPWQPIAWSEAEPPDGWGYSYDASRAQFSVRAEPVSLDYHSRPARVAAHWAPYLLLLALLGLLAVLAVTLAADEPGASTSSAPATPSVVMVPPALTRPLLPPAAAPGPTTAPTPAVPPTPALADPDTAFLRGLGDRGWPLARLDAATLEQQGKSVCELVIGPPAMDDEAAARIVAERSGATPERASEFVAVAHATYCVAGVIA
jgi:hypothetical protein